MSGIHVQKRGGNCRDPPFEHFAAKPYVIGLQDLAFRCSDAVHDLLHVEPQTPCLLSESGKLVVDWVLRCASRVISIECP